MSLCNSCTPLLVGTWECTEWISAQYIPMYRPKEGYNYYVSRSIARLRVAEIDFVHDMEKTILSKSWMLLSTHSAGFLAARTSRTNERQDTYRTNDFQSIYRPHKETWRTNEF